MANNTALRNAIMGQLFSIMNEFLGFDDSQSSDFSIGTTTKEEIAQFNTRCVAAIERVAGTDSFYYRQAIKATDKGTMTSGHLAIELYGVISALYHDVEGNYLQTTTELIHANLFSDFFSMGDYLLVEGYKDAAAVIISGVLETHLRQLALKFNIDIMYHSKGKTDTPKKAETLNQELAKVAYDRLQQKSVTAWLDLRNSSAHADYDKYDAADVKLFSESLKSFLEKFPA